MTYSFRRYLDALDGNWHDDDDLLRRLLRARAGPVDGADGSDLRAWGQACAGPLRELAERSALPENRPRLRHFDAYGRRVDEVVLPGSTREALAEVEGRHGLGAVSGDPRVHYAMAYLYWQNGEAGVACSMACTDGLVRLVEAVGERSEHARAAKRIRGSSIERVWHGAQFVTEIQGGSDVPANEVEARRDGDAFRIHGLKWFCSNVNADYFVVTARPEGAPEGGRGVGVFLVPAYLDGAGEERNGHRIERLKEKLGTRALATAEVEFTGAVAYPVAPPGEGIATLIRYVLVPSRVACVVAAAAALRRAERIAGAYADFRTAFGRPLRGFPLVASDLEDLRVARAEALAVLFELVELWERGPDGVGPDREPAGGVGGDGGEGEAAVDFRILLSLAKPVLTRRATSLLHEAMMVLGGNGIEERFSPLPRLYRDGVIMETWEGPHNVLLKQALRDLVRFEVDPEAFVSRRARDPDGALGEALASIVEAPEAPEAGRRMAAWAPPFIRSVGRRVLDDVGG